jgi:hypothetical protein
MISSLFYTSGYSILYFILNRPMLLTYIDYSFYTNETVDLAIDVGSFRGAIMLLNETHLELQCDGQYFIFTFDILVI